MKIIIFLANILCVTYAQVYYYDYYWRDYTGVIPHDAVPGGEDMNGKPTYIGQAFYNGHFLQVGRIYPGNPEMVASRGAILKTKTYIKILCSNNINRFKWFPVNGKTLHVQTTNKHLVRGGSENDRFLNVGRLRYQSELIVGKVTAYNLGDAKLFFPYDNAEKNAQDFEVLIYDLEPIVQYDDKGAIVQYISAENNTVAVEGTILP